MRISNLLKCDAYRNSGYCFDIYMYRHSVVIVFDITSVSLFQLNTGESLEGNPGCLGLLLGKVSLNSTFSRFLYSESLELLSPAGCVSVPLATSAVLTYCTYWLDIWIMGSL